MTREDYLRVGALRDAHDAVDELSAELLLALGASDEPDQPGAQAQASLLVAVRLGAPRAPRGLAGGVGG